MMLIDQGKPVLLVILDLSAAFERVSYCVYFLGWKLRLVSQVKYYFRTTFPDGCYFWYFVRFPFFVIRYTTEISCWFSVLHNVLTSLGVNVPRNGVKYRFYPMTHSCIYHWNRIMNYISSSVFLEECRTLYCWHWTMDDLIYYKFK